MFSPSEENAVWIEVPNCKSGTRNKCTSNISPSCINQRLTFGEISGALALTRALFWGGLVLQCPSGFTTPLSPYKRTAHARRSTRGLASDAAIPGPSRKVEGGGGAREPESGPKVEQDIDEAAARRAALLKRYGKIGDAEPVSVAAEATTGDAEDKATEDTNHDEIWGDCEYPENGNRLPIIVNRLSCG